MPGFATDPHLGGEVTSVKEMVRNPNRIKGDKVKKTLFFVVVAVVLVFAFATSASAAVWNIEKSFRMGSSGARVFPNAYQSGIAGRGYMYDNGAGTRKMVFPGDTVSTESSAAFVYLQWWAVDPTDARQPANGATINKPTANATVNSPHGGFATSTVKCAVCHNVHTAAPAQDAAAPQADTLLRTKAADACGYCHVAKGSSVIDPVYGGVYPIPEGAGHALGEPNCTECHTNVHGADAETEVPSVAGKLLTLATDYGTGSPGGGSTILSRVAAIEASAVAENFGADPKVTGFNVAEYETLVNEDIKNQAVGVFCGGCHEGSYANTLPGASASNALGARSGEFSGHRTMAEATDTWNAGGTISSSEHDSIKVADAAATSCYSCHDADNGYDTGTKAFPHNWGTVEGVELDYDAVTNEFTNQTFAWLIKASDSNRTDDTAIEGTDKTSHIGPNGGTLSDGVCLKCHRWTAGGVGETF